MNTQDILRALSRVWLLARGQLLPDATSILQRAWSLRLMELAALADTILNIVPATADYLIVRQPAVAANIPDAFFLTANIGDPTWATLSPLSKFARPPKGP